MSPVKDILRKKREALVVKRRTRAEPKEHVLNGFPVLPSRGGPKVTHELIQRLLDEKDEEYIARFCRRRPG